MNLKWARPSGVTFEVLSYSDWVIYNDVMVDGEYAVPVGLTFDATPANRPVRIVDIGANVGFFALYCLDRAHTEGRTLDVTCIEGSPSVFAELQRRTSIQSFERSTVSTHHGLVGRRDGSAEITEYEFSGENSLYRSDSGNSVTVEFLDLESLGLDRIDLVKCDIEGSEIDFVSHYPELLTRCERAVFELHPNYCDTERVRELIHASGLARETILKETPSQSVRIFER